MAPLTYVTMNETLSKILHKHQPLVDLECDEECSVWIKTVCVLVISNQHIKWHLISEYLLYLSLILMFWSVCGSYMNLISCRWRIGGKVRNFTPFSASCNTNSKCQTSCWTWMLPPLSVYLKSVNNLDPLSVKPHLQTMLSCVVFVVSI